MCWSPTTGGRWRYVARRDGVDFGFHGCFHEVGEDRIVQTFTFDGDPDGVALETLRFEDLGAGLYVFLVRLFDQRGRG